MASLNKIGERLAYLSGVHALTDVTGFGLLGHLIEMAEGSGLSAILNYKDVSLLEGLQKYLDQMIIPDGVYRNWNSYQDKVSGIQGQSFITLCDPQTSGGLLVAVSPSSKEDFLIEALKTGSNPSPVPIGSFTSRKNNIIQVFE